MRLTAKRRRAAERALTAGFAKALRYVQVRVAAAAGEAATTIVAAAAPGQDQVPTVAGLPLATAAATVNPAAVYDPRWWRAGYQRYARKPAKALYDDTAARAADELGVDYDPDDPALAAAWEELDDETVEEWGAGLGPFVEGQVAAGVAAGDTVSELTGRLRDADESWFSPGRAVLLAAVAVAATYNRSTLASAEVARARHATPAKKTWTTVGDDRVRDAHVEMDGVTVDAAEDFLLEGQYPAAGPHDPRLPVELTVNCRCWLELSGGGEVVDDDTATIDFGDADDEGLAASGWDPEKHPKGPDGRWVSVDEAGTVDVDPAHAAAPEVGGLSGKDLVDRLTADGTMYRRDTNPMPDATRSALTSYMLGSRKFNDGLRTGAEPDVDVTNVDNWGQARRAANLYNDTLAMLDGAQPLQSDAVLWRGLSAKSFPDGAPQVGDVHVEDAFMSTAYNKATADKFGSYREDRSGYQMTVRAPAGTPVLAFGGEYGGNESELILAPGATYRIAEIRPPSTPNTIAELVVDVVGRDPASTDSTRERAAYWTQTYERLWDGFKAKRDAERAAGTEPPPPAVAPPPARPRAAIPVPHRPGAETALVWPFAWDPDQHPRGPDGKFLSPGDGDVIDEISTAELLAPDGPTLAELKERAKAPLPQMARGTVPSEPQLRSERRNVVARGDRPLTVGVDVHGRPTWSTTTSDGLAVTLRSGETTPGRDGPEQALLEEGMAASLLNGAADAYELDPRPGGPAEVRYWSPFGFASAIADAGLTDMATAAEIAQTAKAAVIAELAPGVIHVIPQVMDHPFDNSRYVPALTKHEDAFAASMDHEYGHVRMGDQVTGPDGRRATDRIRDLYGFHGPPGASTYARQNSHEAYAEMYAEWHLTRGTTTNVGAKTYADALGWRTFTDVEEHALAAAAGPPPVPGRWAVIDCVDADGVPYSVVLGDDPLAPAPEPPPAGGELTALGLGRFAGWDPDQHPRGPDGKFLPAGEVGADKVDGGGGGLGLLVRPTARPIPHLQEMDRTTAPSEPQLAGGGRGDVIDRGDRPVTRTTVGPGYGVYSTQTSDGYTVTLAPSGLAKGLYEDDGTVYPASSQEKAAASNAPLDDGMAASLLNGVADAYELDPRPGGPPEIVYETVRGYAFGLVDQGFAPDFSKASVIADNIRAAVHSNERDPPIVHVLPVVMNRPFRDGFHVDGLEAHEDRIAAVMGHEYGHVRMNDQVQRSPADGLMARKKISRLYDESPDQGLSDYAQEDEAEAYAEAYADWHLTRGTTANSTTGTYADELGWRDFEERDHALAAAAGRASEVVGPVETGGPRWAILDCVDADGKPYSIILGDDPFADLDDEAELTALGLGRFEWDSEKHPRGPDGRFGPGDGGGRYDKSEAEYADVLASDDLDRLVEERWLVDALTTENIDNIAYPPRTMTSVDKIGTAIARRLGNDGVPDVVPVGQLDAMLADGRAKEFMARGYEPNDEKWRWEGPSADAPKPIPAAALAEQFRSGDHFMSTATYGSGTYAGYGPEATSVASPYAREDPAAIVRMAFKPDAKVIELHEARNGATNAWHEANKAYEELWAAGDKKRAIDMLQLGSALSDPGRWAAMHGYDAVRASGVLPEGRGEMVIVNRRALIVEEAPDEATIERTRDEWRKTGVLSASALGLGRFAGDWDPAKHPRDESGRFGEADGADDGEAGGADAEVARALASDDIDQVAALRDLTQMSYEPARHDRAMTAMAARLGYDADPDLVDPGGLDAVVDRGGLWMARGVSTDGTRNAADLAEDFRSGPAFYGVGMLGSGIYAAYATPADPLYRPAGRDWADKFARRYSNGEPGGVIHMALAPDAKVIEITDIGPRQKQLLEDWSGKVQEALDAGDKAKAKDYQAALDLMGNTGRWAMAHGYDAIRQTDSNHMVILNRGKVTAERADTTASTGRRPRDGYLTALGLGAFDWDPEKHPRDASGRWAESEGYELVGDGDMPLLPGTSYEPDLDTGPAPSDAAQEVIENYQWGTYEGINELLRGSVPDDDASEDIAVLTAEIDDHHVVPVNVTAWRSVLPGDLPLAVGERFVDKGFTSTDVESGLAAGWREGNETMAIKVPAGTRALATGDHELILQRGTTFEVVRQLPGLVWEVHVVDQRPKGRDPADLVASALGLGAFDWDPEKHPRDAQGRWATSDGDAGDEAGAGATPRDEHSADVLARGDPAEIAKLPWLRDVLHRRDAAHQPPGAPDPLTAELARRLGVDGTPAAGSAAEVDRRVAEGAVYLARGIQPGADGTPAAVYAAQFRTGEPFWSPGVYGDGIYMAGSLPDWADSAKAVDPMAEEYARGAPTLVGSEAKEGGVRVRAALDPDAKVADFAQIATEANNKYLALQRTIDATTDGEQRERLTDVSYIYANPGRYAMTQGYDAVRDAYVVLVLNRDKLLVDRDDYDVSSTAAQATVLGLGQFDFDPARHPRDEHGRWAEAEGVADKAPGTLTGPSKTDTRRISGRTVRETQARFEERYGIKLVVNTPVSMATLTGIEDAVSSFAERYPGMLTSNRTDIVLLGRVLDGDPNTLGITNTPSFDADGHPKVRVTLAVGAMDDAVARAGELRAQDEKNGWAKFAVGNYEADTVAATKIVTDHELVHSLHAAYEHERLLVTEGGRTNSQGEPYSDHVWRNSIFLGMRSTVVTDDELTDTYKPIADRYQAALDEARGELPKDFADALGLTAKVPGEPSRYAMTNKAEWVAENYSAARNGYDHHPDIDGLVEGMWDEVRAARRSRGEQLALRPDVADLFPPGEPLDVYPAALPGQPWPTGWNPAPRTDAAVTVLGLGQFVDWDPEQHPRDAHGRFGPASFPALLGAFEYDENQERDERGRWAKEGGGGGDDKPSWLDRILPWRHPREEGQPEAEAPPARDEAAVAAFRSGDPKQIVELDWLHAVPDTAFANAQGLGVADGHAAAIAAHVGADGPPRAVAGQAEMDRLAFQPGAMYATRGLHDSIHSSAGEAAEALRSGPAWYSLGVVGSGTYAAYTGGSGVTASKASKDLVDAVAKDYAGRGQGGATVAMVVDPDARLVTYAEAKKAAQHVTFAAMDEAGKARRDGDMGLAQRYQKVASVMADPGRWALANGYDAVVQPGEGYMTILNRAPVTVAKAGVTVKRVAPAMTVLGLGRFADWDPDQHPRGPDGRFGPGDDNGGFGPVVIGGVDLMAPPEPEPAPPARTASSPDEEAVAALQSGDVDRIVKLDWLTEAANRFGAGYYGEGNDPTAAALAKHLGADGPPRVVDAEELARLAAEPGAMPALRGMRDVNALQRATEFAEQFRSGDTWHSYGAIGSATYAAYTGGSGATTSEATTDTINTAAYAYAGNHGTVLRMVVDPDARVISAEAANQAAQDTFNDAQAAAQEARRHGDEPLAVRYSKVGSALVDPGRWALANGYDAVVDPEIGYMALLRRDRVAVQEADETVTASADWDEAKHPRDASGRFGQGGAGDEASAEVLRSGDIKAMVELDWLFDTEHPAYADPGFRADPSAVVIVERLGADGPPRAVVDAATLDRLAGEAGAMVAHRGVHDAPGLTGAAIAEEFRSGDAWYALGAAGSGTYVAYTGGVGDARSELETEHAEGMAGTYARGSIATHPEPGGTILRMVVGADARLVSLQDAEDAAGGLVYDASVEAETARAAGNEPLAVRYDALGYLMGDAGRWALTQGYDGIVAPSSGIMVVLDRAKVTVEEPPPLTASADWDPAKHPRDEKGRFGEADGGADGDVYQASPRDEHAAEVLASLDPHAIAKLDWLAEARPVNYDTYRSGSTDVYIASIAEHLGVDGPPNVVDRAEIDRIVENGGYYLTRGLENGLPPDSGGDGRTALEYAEQFRSGEPYWSTGVYGSGIYAAAAGPGSPNTRERVDEITTVSYGRSERGGTQLRMALDPDAKVVMFPEAMEKASAVWQEAARAQRAADTPEQRDRLKVVKEVLADTGRWAMTQGYDAILDPDNGYMAILNRAKVSVERADDDTVTASADWDEAKHPRDESGRFGEGGGADADRAELAKVLASDDPDQLIKLDWLVDAAKQWPPAPGQPDPIATAVAARLGLDGPPTVVDTGEVDRLVDGGATYLTRGIAPSIEGRPAADLAEQFRSGDAFYGTGIYGSGTYTAYSPAGEAKDMADRVAEEYSNAANPLGRGTPGAVLRMALDPDAKVISVMDATNPPVDIAGKLYERSEAAKAAGDEAAAAEIAALSSAMYDAGVWGMMHGYDAVSVEAERPTDPPFMIVLDRAKVAVERAALTASADWDPAKHPRDAKGRFGDADEGEAVQLPLFGPGPRDPAVAEALAGDDPYAVAALPWIDAAAAEYEADPYGRDPWMSRITEATGIAANKPELVSVHDIDDAVDAGATYMARGFNADNATEITAAEKIEQFRHGDPYYAPGMYGSGIYAAYAGDGGTDAVANAVAADYANGNPAGVVRMALKADANVIDQPEAEERMLAQWQAWMGEATRVSEAGDQATAERLASAAGALGQNLGRWAAAHGYDAVAVPSDGYMVILNRGAVLAEKRPDYGSLTVLGLGTFAEWDPDKHPRDEKGRFGEAGADVNWTPEERLPRQEVLDRLNALDDRYGLPVAVLADRPVPRSLVEGVEDSVAAFDARFPGLLRDTGTHLVIGDTVLGYPNAVGANKVRMWDTDGVPKATIHLSTDLINLQVAGGELRQTLDEFKGYGQFGVGDYMTDRRAYAKVVMDHEMTHALHLAATAQGLIADGVKHDPDSGAWQETVKWAMEGRRVGSPLTEVFEPLDLAYRQERYAVTRMIRNQDSPQYRDAAAKIPGDPSRYAMTSQAEWLAENWAAHENGFPSHPDTQRLMDDLYQTVRSKDRQPVAAAARPAAQADDWVIDTVPYREPGEPWPEGFDPPRDDGLTASAEWDPEKHPRGAGGRFGEAGAATPAGLPILAGTEHAPALDTGPLSTLRADTAVGNYQSYGYTRINGALRSGNFSKPVPEIVTLTREIDLHKVAHDVTVYRNVDTSRFPLQVGKTWTDRGFTSTDTDGRAALEFSHGIGPQPSSALLAIRVDAGLRGVTATKVLGQGDDVAGKERELILQRDSTFEVVGPLPSVTRSDGAALAVWEVNLIDQRPEGLDPRSYTHKEARRGR